MVTKSDLEFYRERWKAVEEIERQELRAMSFESRWKQINDLALFAKINNMKRGDEHENDVFLRWAKLKNAEWNQKRP